MAGFFMPKIQREVFSAQLTKNLRKYPSRDYFEV